VPIIRAVVFVGPALDEVRAFPEAARKLVGFALYRAQEGKLHPNAKPLKGFGGAGVLEVVADNDGDTYRAIYTVRLATAVYVLHAFQKKSAHGAVTPRREMDLVRSRLAWAQRIEATRGSDRTQQQPEQPAKGERT
jgi:phage-related protein